MIVVLACWRLTTSVLPSRVAIEVVPCVLEAERGVDAVGRTEVRLPRTRFVEEAVARGAVAGAPRSDVEPGVLCVVVQLLQGGRFFPHRWRPNLLRQCMLEAEGGARRGTLAGRVAGLLRRERTAER